MRHIQIADLTASANEIDTRMGPIPGRSSDRIANELRWAADELQRAMDMLGDVPGQSLTERLQTYIGHYMALQLKAAPPVEPVRDASCETGVLPVETIDSVPSCGQENDYRRAKPDWKQDQADTSVMPRKAAPVEPTLPEIVHEKMKQMRQGTFPPLPEARHQSGRFLIDALDALEAIDSEIVLTGHLKELVDCALAARNADFTAVPQTARDRSPAQACDGCANTGWCHANDKCYLKGCALSLPKGKQ